MCELQQCDWPFAAPPKKEKVLLADVSVEGKREIIFLLNIDISVERTIYKMVRAEVATWCV
jgi:hypothetical protein